MTLTPEEMIAAVDALRVERDRGKFATYFPDCTDQCRPRSRNPDDHVGMCRVLYRKHLAWFNASERERLLIAANRIGKTQAGAYETTAHLTGLYPRWWKGRQFTGPVTWWAVGDTSKTVRDIGQLESSGTTGRRASRSWASRVTTSVERRFRARGNMASGWTKSRRMTSMWSVYYGRRRRMISRAAY